MIQLATKTLNENKETLVAKFILEYPEVDIKNIVLVQRNTPDGLEFSVKCRDKKDKNDVSC